MRESIRRGAMFCILMFTLSWMCGCQSSPQDEVITNKNQDRFSVEDIQSAVETNGEDATQEAVFDDSFYSTDCSVIFQMNIDTTLNDPDMPVIEVQPHYLTSEDARRVAAALFGEGVFYEADPVLEPTYCKEEIQQKLTRWTAYSTSEAIADLYGESRDRAVTVVREAIAEYTQMYETAPDENQDPLCRWEFQKVPYYLMSIEEADATNTATETDSIQASVQIDGLPYRINFETRNQADYKANYICAEIDDGTSPYFIDDRIFYAKLCRTEKPTEQQVDVVTTKAEAMLQEMELGDWQIDEVYVDQVDYGDNTEYMICINAVPVLNGVPAVRQAQPTELTSDDVYASNYYMTDVSFQFAPTGELLRFVMYSPIDIYQILSENVAVMAMDELVDRAKEILSYSDYYNYDPDLLITSVDEEVLCVVDICDLEYNLNRIRVPDMEDHYYYVPCVTLKGTVEFSGKDSNSVYYYSEKPILLISLNAIDGSVIETK